MIMKKKHVVMRKKTGQLFVLLGHNILGLSVLQDEDNGVVVIDSTNFITNYVFVGPL